MAHGPWSIIAHTDAADAYLRADASLFKGWYVDHDRERLVFGSPGVGPQPDPADPIEGAYVSMRLAGGVVSLGNDLFCQLPLLHFCTPELFVASDSLFALTEVRKALGLPRRLNPEVARARAWTRTLSQQNHSDMTLVSDVECCGVGAWLTMDLGGQSIARRVESRPARSLFTVPHESYAQAIRLAAVRTARHLASLASGARVVSCSLSGGQDSRAVVAAASLVADAAHRIRIRSNPRAPADIRIAEELAALAGLELHALQAGHRYSGAPSRLAAWLVQSAGLYDRLQFPPDCDPAEGILTAGGHGGELAKGMWRWWRVTTLTLAAPIRYQSSLRAECRRGLGGMGLSPRSRASAEWHYLGFRNAIHGGRQSAAFLLNSSPLMQRSLVSLARSDLCAHPAPRRGAASIISDLNIVLRPDMAVHRYKDALAFMSAPHVAIRLAALGGPLAPAAADPYETRGDPGAAQIRSSPVFLGRASRLEAPGSGEVPRQLATALAGWERCPPDAAFIYRPMAARLEAARARGGPLTTDEDCMAAKLAALHLLD